MNERKSVLSQEDEQTVAHLERGLAKWEEIKIELAEMPADVRRMAKEGAGVGVLDQLPDLLRIIRGLEDRLRPFQEVRYSEWLEAQAATTLQENEPH